MIAAAVVTWLILMLVAWAICTSAKHHDQAAAFARHPGNYVGPVPDLKDWKMSLPLDREIKMPGVGMAPTIQERFAEVCCAFCGTRVLIVRLDDNGVPIVHGVTLEDQLSAHDRDCLERASA